MFQDVVRLIALILWRRLSARPARSSDKRTCHRGSYGPRSILGCPHKHPSGFIAHCQSWQPSPGLKHGHVESIDQLAWYHAQFNTPMEWRRQFCSGETRFDRYAVYPEWLAFQFSEPKKQSCLVEHLSFLVHVVLDLICWSPSATRLTTI